MTTDIDVLVPDPQVRKELGGLSEMAPWRWDQALKSGHPEKAPLGWQPPVRIGPRKFRLRSMVETVKRNLLRAAIDNCGKAA